MSGSSDCDVGTQEVDDFDWTEFGIMVLTGFLQETPAETSAWFYILFLISLTKPEYSITERLISISLIIYGQLFVNDFEKSFPLFN